MEMHKGISVKASTNIACSIIKHLFCKLVLKLSKKLKKRKSSVKVIFHCETQWNEKSHNNLQKRLRAPSHSKQLWNIF